MIGKWSADVSDQEGNYRGGGETVSAMSVHERVTVCRDLTEKRFQASLSASSFTQPFTRFWCFHAHSLQQQQQQPFAQKHINKQPKMSKTEHVQLVTFSVKHLFFFFGPCHIFFPPLWIKVCIRDVYISLATELAVKATNLQAVNTCMDMKVVRTLLLCFFYLPKDQFTIHMVFCSSWPKFTQSSSITHFMTDEVLIWSGLATNHSELTVRKITLKEKSTGNRWTKY